MRAVVWAALCVCLGVALAGCGGEKESEPVDTAQSTPGGTADDRQVPQPLPLSGISQEVVDTLRVLKTRFNISRDEYWRKTGGVLANDYFEVWYPPGRTTVTHAIRIFQQLVPARARLETEFQEVPVDPLVIYLTPDEEMYKKDTGREWWYYAVIKGDTITYSPLYPLVKRGIIDVAIDHEYYQWAIGKLSRGGAPRWLEEGLASHLCGEGDLLYSQIREFPDRTRSMRPSEIEGVLAEEATRGESRVAYYLSYRMVKKLADEYGEDKLRAVVLMLGRGYPLDETFETVFGMKYEEAVTFASDYEIEIN